MVDKLLTRDELSALLHHIGNLVNVNAAIYGDLSYKFDESKNKFSVNYCLLNNGKDGEGTVEVVNGINKVIP